MASRKEFYRKLGMSTPVAMPVLKKAFELEEEQIWRENLFSSPHGSSWFTSFHVSSFPGDDPKACPRKALYTMMNIPDIKPINIQGRLVMEAGLNIEDSVVKRFERSGLLLSNSPDEEHQTGFVNEEHWLTGSPDAIILNPKTNSPYVIEVKTKYQNVIDEMKNGDRSYDPLHRHQVSGYIGLAHENAEMWPELEKCTQGSILYLSRDKPSDMHEYKFDYDPEYMKEGKARLKFWKESYLNEELPPRPKEWKWTETPCKFCQFKKACKQDMKDGVTKLSESNTIKTAIDVYIDEYSYEQTREKVLERWEEGVK